MSDQLEKKHALHSIILSVVGIVAFVLSTIKGDWWMQCFSLFAVVLSFIIAFWRYRKQKKQKFVNIFPNTKKEKLEVET